MVQVLCPVVVGRRHELADLADAVDAAVAGDGGCVALVGEAGIGKSRLASETAQRARDKGATVVIGRASPSGAAGAYRPLTEALSQALRERTLPTTERMRPWLPALSGILPEAQAGVPAAAQLSAAARGEAVVRLLSSLSKPGGLLVLLEDLHWADPDTLAIVEYLGDNLRSERVLCLFTVRSEEPSAALDLLRRRPGRHGIRRVELGRLSASEVSTMVRSCLPQVDPATLERVCSDADGVPLVVEELLASPGLPRSFADTVRQRLDQFDEQTRTVIDLAAVLGRRFDWRLLPSATGRSEDVVIRALGEAVERMLVRVEDGVFRFRHALTRDAVLEQLMPPVQASLARVALAAVRDGHPDLEGGWLDVAVELAARAGDREEEAALRTEAGHRALDSGALATAIESLSAAVRVKASGSGAVAPLRLVEAFALAGRVDEALGAGRQALAGVTDRAARAELHLRLAQAAVSAGRWALAGEQLSNAAGEVGNASDSALEGRIAVLDAEVALADNDVARAHRRASEALEQADGPSELRCHALEVLGRIERYRDQAEARRLFEEALQSADAARLPVWQTRALHELGTIDMFDHLGTDLLYRARASAERQGALSTAATLDLQLAAVHVSRWAPAEVTAHGEAALALAETLRLEEVREKALMFLAESCALRAEPDRVEEYLARIGPAGTGSSPMSGFAWGIRAEAALTSGDLTTALGHLGRATSILDRLPYAEPAAFRALWPLLLAAEGDARGPEAARRARSLGVEAFSLNRGLLGYADAILAGRAGDRDRAGEIAAEAGRSFVNGPTWRTLAQVLASRAAAKAEWGSPAAWLEEGVDVFNAAALPGLSRWCQGRISATDGRGPSAGITVREQEVLALIAGGLSNKEIAATLRVSPRTVEKHVESLLRKTGTRSRTQLAVRAGRIDGQEGMPARNA